ncbi:uncharacterized protein BDZ99DRAFT_466512 [Mytilinidion resinicola]|uniref:Mitochondrial fission process protein 1 n=1 Tax=Mytilinidion resinicola TaxID=574789 RepID=A0A6A6YAK6_9PEZI|nr:uncharacterized protein BDZ99DRAFT_466512 [Mytilinidion resinicola]KAF2805533.1 hypothetical protein BDZ99DRAFT_466512 [Mytilinidion resinicola]
MAKKDNDTDDIPHEREGARPDYSVQPARKILPKGLQETLDDDEKLWETLYDGSSGDTTDSDLRYAAYASRVRTILRAGQRYIAYTSDIGESFRPVAHPWLVKGAYAVSWLYLAGDVSHEGYKAYLRNQRVLHPELHNAEKDSSGNSIVEGVKKLLPAGVADGSAITGTHVVPGIVPAIEDYRSVMAQRALFQGLASMGLPAFTIHSIVKYSGKAMKDVKNVRIRTYGPIGLGLAAVPFLPFIFDEPVEKAVEWVFHKGFEAVGGPEAVAGRPVTGLKELRREESKAGAAKEKEL